MTAPEPGTPAFRHDNRARGPANLVLLAAVVVVCGAALWTGAGNVLLILAAVSIAGLVYFKLFDPRAGIEIAGDSVAFWRGRRRQAVPLAEIDHVAMRQGDGKRGATIHGLDGSRLDVPGRCLPEPGVLAEALKRAGVKVSEGREQG